MPRHTWKFSVQIFCLNHSQNFKRLWPDASMMSVQGEYEDGKLKPGYAWRLSFRASPLNQTQRVLQNHVSTLCVSSSQFEI